MRPLAALLGAVLAAAPMFSSAPPDPRAAASYLLQFTLEETPDQIVKKMGKPAAAGELGPNYALWQYQIGVEDHHDFSHVLCVRRGDGKLVSVTRNAEKDENVDVLMGANARTYHWPSRERPQWAVRVRTLTGGRLLIAMGSSKPGEPVRQLMLIRRDSVSLFVPWLAEQLP